MFSFTSIISSNFWFMVVAVLCIIKQTKCIASGIRTLTNRRKFRIVTFLCNHIVLFYVIKKGLFVRVTSLIKRGKSRPRRGSNSKLYHGVLTLVLKVFELKSHCDE